MIRLWFSALTYVLFLISCLAVIPCFIWGIVDEKSRGAYLAAGFIGLAILMGLAYLILSAGVRCPLCRGLVIFRLRSSSVHRKANRLFGSVRLGIALAVIFGLPFRCYHCGEPCDSRRVRRRG